MTRIKGELKEVCKHTAKLISTTTQDTPTYPIRPWGFVYIDTFEKRSDTILRKKQYHSQK
jgi:hypothetical protein